ncbi:MAG: excinuclease ABC subunit UvrB [Microgenomates group bacterium]
MRFKLHSNYQPSGDQPDAIKKIVEGINSNAQHQTLLGVTGSGKTYTMANVIEQTQKPTLVIAHNKTLAAQLYQEFRDFFPENAVSYFVSYYDYYQPEAYIPSSDTYIEKEATINDEIDKLRLATTTHLLTRPDTIVVASVSCIYNLGSPVEYGKFLLKLVEGMIIKRESLFLQLSNLQYDRTETELRRGTYRIRGDMIQLWPAYEDRALRIDTLSDKITKIAWIDPISGSPATPSNTGSFKQHAEGKRFIIYPAKHYVMDPKSQTEALKQIEIDLQNRLKELREQNKIIEAYRLEQKVHYDIEMMQEFGYTNGIENYSVYFDTRISGQPPFSLLDYFIENSNSISKTPFLTIVDESHITLPQIRGMFFGDRSRKETLIEYGFRLPSALDNRPLKFDEFMGKTEQMVYVSATPEELEISLSKDHVIEQLIRPTGLVDPTIELRPIEGQIEDLVIEIILRKQIGQRTLVTTLTKKMAEALTDYLNDQQKIDTLISNYYKKKKAASESDQSENVVWANEDLPVDAMEIGPIDSKYYHHLQRGIVSQIFLDNLVYPAVAYLHSDIETLERSDILDDLRRGVYDVVVGINLLREGLDLPEVSLVAILDADKEGFLRSRTALIQTMGRAARHQEGHTILYANRLTKSMKASIGETLRRRHTQIAFNTSHGLTPASIQKPFRDRMVEKNDEDDKQFSHDTSASATGMVVQLTKNERIDLSHITPAELTPADKTRLSKKLKRRMNDAVKEMDFELAAILRDTIATLK